MTGIPNAAGPATAEVTPEEVRARCPHARVSRATRRQCGFAPFALAYKDDARLAMLILQPDDAMKAHLIERLRK